MHKLTAITVKYRLLIGILLMLIPLTFILLLKGKHYLIFSFMGLICSLLPAYWKFENDNISTKLLMFVAVLVALAVAGRVPLAAIPSVQAASFIIIMGGVFLGPDLGFITGSTTAIISNMFLGQGPWTPWQMLAWGLMGLTAGLIGKTKLSEKVIPMAIFGGIWGFVFGWIMDLWFALAYVNPLTVKSFFLAFASSAAFDLNHALANIVLIVLLYKPWRKIFTRLINKYQII